MQAPGRPQRADLGRRRRPRRLRHPALQGGRRQRGRRRLLRREGRAGQAARRRRLHQPQRVRGHDADGRRDRRTRRRRASRSRAASPSGSRRSSATRPTSSSSTSARRPSRPRCFVVKPFGKVVICGATSGYNLDFDVRYLWMRQKQIIGSHFANAYECMRANQLMAEGKIRPVLWQTMGFDGVAEAHQLLHENKHLGKISILVGAERGRGQERGGPGRDPGRGRRLSGHGMMPDDHTTSTGTSTPSGRTAGSRSGSRRGDRALAFGAKGWSLTRNDRRPAALPPGLDLGRATPTSSATGTRTRSPRSASRPSTSTTSRSCPSGTR